MTNTYDVSIKGQSNGTPNISFTLSQRSVILGANGTGKSKTLQFLRGELKRDLDATEIIYVDGGRAITGPSPIELKSQHVDATREFAMAALQGERQSTLRLSKRLDKTVSWLVQVDEQAKRDHSDAISNWERSGEVEPRPRTPRLLVDEMSKQFGRIFPGYEIQLKAQGTLYIVTCIRGDNSYSASAMSDGERQVLALIIELLLLNTEKPAFIVDEPELNLHPALASRLWDTIEQAYPESMFVYATHSLSFAMRPNIEKVVVLGHSSNQPLELDCSSEIPMDELRPFLGALPGILSAEKAIIVEGTDESFDTTFFRWLLDDSTVSIQGIGDCHTVKRAAAASGVWQNLASAVKIIGVIDRDFRPSERLGELSHDTCIVLGLHEAESYLCYPAVVHCLAERLGACKETPSEATLEDQVFKFFKARIPRIAARRTAELMTINLGVSVPRKTLRILNDEQKILAALKECARLEAAKVQSRIGEQEVDKIFNEEVSRCRRALNDRDLESALQLAPGKELLACLSPIIGCKDPSMFLRTAMKHLRVEDFPHLQQLRDRLRSKLG